MASIILLAWRSLWRNRRRTVITLCAIAFALAIAVFFISFAEGIYYQMVQDAARMGAGHLTLEHAAYRDAPAADLVVADVTRLRHALEAQGGVVRTKALVLGQCLVKTSSAAVGVALQGVEPGVEAATTPLASKIVAGDYLADSDSRSIFLGYLLAERLNVTIGKKVVVATSNAAGDMVEELVRVKGIFKIGAVEVDGYLVQVPIGLARRLYGIAPDAATQIGVLLDAEGQKRRAAKMAEVAATLPPTVVVRRWEDVMPELAASIQVDSGSNRVFQAIIIFLSLFTIFNTILMSVLERTREFAMMLALGTHPGRLQLQILFESMGLAVLGCAIGLGLGGAAAYYMEVVGLDVTGLVMDGDLAFSGYVMNPIMHARLEAGLMAVLGGAMFVATMAVSLLAMGRVRHLNITTALR
jgi:ABC-type lipoprotein release transport system permease subunit